MATKDKPKKNYAVVKAGSHQDRELLLENLALLMSSGLNAQVALENIKDELKSPKLKHVVETMQSDIDNGLNFWRALDNSRLFPAYAVTFIKIGEESGRLSENLQVVVKQQEKDRGFRSKLRSAMMYPSIVLCLSFLVGGGIAWFILPRLASLFRDLKVKLPLPTRIMIGAGVFLHKNGLMVMAAIIVVTIIIIISAAYSSKVRQIPIKIARHVPGLGKLIQQIELARFGFIAGTLLEAGLSIVDVFTALSQATQQDTYRQMYQKMSQAIEEGNSFKAIFADRKIDKLLPRHMQALIVAGEQSGKLAPTLTALGAAYEEKIDITSKNLATLLEPIMLVFVWLFVATIALAVILPIYRLIGGLQ